MPLKDSELRTALAYSHYGIMDFLGKWHDALIRGARSPQQKAAWIIWTRWAIANRALHHLHHEEDIPDCFTLARLGLELVPRQNANRHFGEGDVAVRANENRVTIVVLAADIGRKHRRAEFHSSVNSDFDINAAKGGSRGGIT